MADFSMAEASQIAIHKVGNKLREEGIQFSKTLFDTEDEELKILLLKYLLTPFKHNESYHFHNSIDISLNAIYTLASKVFEDHSQLYEVSRMIAWHLYEQSVHPKVKAGEMYVLLLNNCKIDGYEVDALGIFKSENKETFLKVNEAKEGYELQQDEGLNLNRLDKGCIIFDLEKENGYKVCIVDQLNGTEAQYWKNDFLMLKPVEDEHFHTANYLNFCKSFVTEKLPENFDLNKADQALLLTKSINYFKKNDKFDIDDFSMEVMAQPEVIDAFKSYRNEYENEREIHIADDFEISAPAVKKQQRVFKSILKLDKNFHIYIHGDRSYIEKGYDEASGFNYYKVYFKEEH